jgi:hypothetical protein
MMLLLLFDKTCNDDTYAYPVSVNCTWDVVSSFALFILSCQILSLCGVITGLSDVIKTRLSTGKNRVICSKKNTFAGAVMLGFSLFVHLRDVFFWLCVDSCKM